MIFVRCYGMAFLEGERRCKKRLDYELSRNQILGRTGMTGRGQSTAFRFGPGQIFSSYNEAEKAAKAWLIRNEAVA